MLCQPLSVRDKFCVGDFNVWYLLSLSSSTQPVSSLVLLSCPACMTSFELLITFYMSIARYSWVYILIYRNYIRNDNICLQFISYLNFILYHLSESQILKFHKLSSLFCYSNIIKLHSLEIITNKNYILVNSHTFHKNYEK